MTRDEAQAEADRLESEAMTRGQMASLQESIDALLAEVRKGREFQRAVLLDAHAHLGAALAQTIPTDDPTIMGHVRSAKEQLALLIEQPV